MDCLNNLLSLSAHCGLPTPTSGVYINTLPGISTEFAQKIASGDQVTFLDVWNACLVEAGADLKQDVLIFLSKKVNFVESQYTTAQAFFRNNLENILPVENEKRGVRVDLPEGRHVRLHLKGVWLHTTEESSTDIVITDYASSEVLETIVGAAGTGLRYIPVNKYYGNAGKEILIEVDGSEIEQRLFAFKVSGHHYDSCNTCCFPYDATKVYPTLNGQNASYPHGIWIDAEIICSIESFICQHIHKFVQCLKHKMGEKLLDYKLMSYRVNVFSSSPTEFTETKIQKYNDRYKELLQLTLDQIDLTNEGVCFDCEDKLEITTSYMMP